MRRHFGRRWADAFWLGRTLAALALALLVLGPTGEAFAACVSDQEALATADAWLGMELDSRLATVAPVGAVKKDRRLANRQLHYLVGGVDLVDERPAKGDVWAYVVAYQPGGYVVVSAEDAIEPVLAFDAWAQFIWNEPGVAVVRVLLRRILVNRRANVPPPDAKGAVAVHPLWAVLRGQASADNLGTTKGTKAILVELPTASWSQGGYYNDTVQAHNGGDNGIPTGCTATAMAILMRYFSWPATGSGSHSYSDTSGDVRYSHSVNFGAQSYNWGAMPTGNITSVNSHVANLMYHCGVAVNMNYEVGGSGAWPSASAMNSYFRYRGTIQRTSSHEAPIIASVRGGVPVVLSTTKHTVVCDGYRDTPAPYYRINAGHDGGSDGWYSLTTLPAGSDPTIDRSYPYGVPNNFVYVDINWGGTENGTLQEPYDTLSEGNTAVPTGGFLWVKGGTYTGASNVPITFTKRMTVQSYRGTATVR